MGKITVVGNYVEIPSSEVLNKGGEDKVIAFIGKMDYEPNVLAVEYFCREILPEISRLYPSVVFYIIGASPDKRVKELAALSNVNVTGFVESIEPYFKKAALIVAPMLTGSGIQNKIIQSMAHSCCVITTSIGAEGLSVKESGLVICNSREEWINSIKKLLNDRTVRIEHGVKARQYVINNMSKDIVREQFDKFINNK